MRKLLTTYISSQPAPTPNYLCFEAEEAGSTVQLNKNGTPTVVELEVSTDGVAWSDYTIGNSITLANVGDKVYMRNKSETDTRFTTDSNNYYQFSMTGRISSSGDITSLLNKNGTTRLSNYCYRHMFYGCTSLTTAPSLPDALAFACYVGMFQGCTSLTAAPELPATTLTNSCYTSMFQGCTSLTAAPELPATTLRAYCYNGMFKGCTSLITAPEFSADTVDNGCCYSMFEGCTSLTTTPELPATTLAQACYKYMFRGCTSLTTPPELPATTLANQCYEHMFYECSNLTTAPELPATTLANNCYQSMFQGCTSLTAAPELPATTLNAYCYASMFSGCTSLTAAPELPATTLAEHCCEYMFSRCPGLTAAPELPATTLADSCYYVMFSGCSGLTTVPELPATTLADYCYQYMFSNCASLTTLPELPATTLADYCYQFMFSSCTNIKLSETQTGEYQIPYRIPTTGTGTDATGALGDMFLRTGGTFTGTPTINTTYYLRSGTTPVTTAGIYHNEADGLISLSSDGENWITIADKNLGATQVWNDGDELTQENCGGFFQRGNNYMFSFSGDISNTSTSKIDASGYGPGNYYSSDIFRKIQYGDRSSVQNDNLRGDTTDTLDARQGPCTTGYHIPTEEEILKLISMPGADLKNTLFFPDMGRRIYTTNIDGSGTVGYYWTSTPSNTGSKFLHTTNRSTSEWNRPNAMPIRPFKNEPVVPTSERTVLYQPN